MTPGQLGQIVLLQNELNSIYLKVDTLGRTLELARDKPAAQSMRQVCAHLNCVDAEFTFVIRAEKSLSKGPDGRQNCPPDPIL